MNRDALIPTVQTRSPRAVSAWSSGAQRTLLHPLTVPGVDVHRAARLGVVDDAGKALVPKGDRNEHCAHNNSARAGRHVGRQADGRSWQIGIVRPLHTDAAIATPSLAEGAVTTSGGYERFVEIEGRRYSHLIDPRAGHRAGSFTRCYGRSMACQPVVLCPSDLQSHSEWPEVSDSKARSTSQRSSSSYSRTSSAVFAPVLTYV